PQRWYGRVGWSEGAVPIVATGDFKTSYSRLSVYDNCPLQYLLQCVLGLDATQTHSMKFGTWMHALFRAVHAGVIAEPAILLAEYARLFDERVFPNATIARQYRRDGEKMLETFWRYEVDARTVRAEHPFSFPFAGAMLRGRIDRVDKMERPDPLRPHLKLTDYKTSRWAGGIEEARDSLQLAIYYLAARTSPDLKELGEPIAARLVYPGATLADGKPIERVQNASDAERVIEGLPDLIARVLSEDFRPSPEADCTWCQMKPLCPLWPQGRELSP
ncbi:MAG: RecB family exonuclease, partial [Candidatus Methylomirabilales bacterium]